MKPAWKCEECGRTFHAYLRTGGVAPRVCSRACSGRKTMRLRMEREPSKLRQFTCVECGKTFLAYPAHRKSQVTYCSTACQASARRGIVPVQLRDVARPTGANAFHWKGGRTIDKGYILIRVGRRYIREHRLVMAQLIGRELSHDDVVHHVNENKQDNRPENLQLMTRAEHAKLHSAR